LITNDTEVTISEVSGKTWYVIANDSSTVTLLSKESFENKAFNSSGTGNDYATSEIKTYVVGLTGEGKPLAGINSVIVGEPYLIDTGTAEQLSETKRKGAGTDWWLCSPGIDDVDMAAFVDGGSGDVDDVFGFVVGFTLGVRPALKLNLSSIIFESESKTFSLKPAGYSVTLSGGANATTSGGASSQTGLTGAMTTVTYTANTGYYFAEFADISSNGITATRTSSTVVTVSGTPTADATITVPNAVEKTAATVTTAPTAKSLTYNGSAQELVTAGIATGGTMWYALGENATAAPADNLYTTSIPTATNAGTYYVWYKVVGDDNHTDSEPDCVTVTIEEQKQNKDEAVANVIDLINKLPSPSEVTANDKEQIEAARAAYDALTDEQKSQISEETLKKLTDIEASLAEVLKNTGDTQQNPDGSKTVTKENADGKTISVTNYSKTDEQISQFVFKKANGTKLDLKNVNSKSLKTVVVPATVKANGKTYKVTRIRKGFLKNCKQATKVDIGKNINTIDKNAFNYGKKVKTVIIRGKLKKVGKGAFKKTKKNVTIEVKTGAKNFEKNKKLLVKSGLPKNATVKRVKNKK
jgi:methionine-rich copper-binding protein CopC